uniref:Uncharacterized protein n=1 Tax=Trichogramma kaykai TaxID=54128 RepID=A0ABD2VWP8_9HYME
MLGVVKQFLVLGQDPNCPAEESEASWDYTPLSLAVHWAREIMWLYLLKNGAKLDLAGSRGLTPLHVICTERFVNSVKYFFKIIDDIGLEVQINVQSNEKWTLLQLAVANIEPEIVEVILDRGADLSRFALHDKTVFEKDRIRYIEDKEKNKF